MAGQARPREGKSKITLTMDAEVVWRLRTIATMQGVAPGALAGPWIRPHVSRVRLPYDAYRRGAVPADRADDDGATLPIAEGPTPPGGESPAAGPGQGQGRKRA